MRCDVDAAVTRRRCAHLPGHRGAEGRELRGRPGQPQGLRLLHDVLAHARAARTSRGHRTLAGGPVEIASVDGYHGALREAHVIADGDERRTTIFAGLDEQAAAAGGAVIPDEGLVKLTADLVEWPVVVTGRYTEEFLELPSLVTLGPLAAGRRAG